MSKELVQKFGEKPWFHSVSQDEYGRHVVYVKYMNYETYHDIPDNAEDGKQVLVHFAGYLEASPEKFVKMEGKPLILEEEDKEIVFMEMEIFALKRICGEENLVDILYEIHEGEMGQCLFLTDLSKKFPDVRERLEKLYHKFGCDVIFEELGEE